MFTFEIVAQMQSDGIRLQKMENLKWLKKEGFYQNIVKIASIICDTPIALISIVEKDIQWFKARIGLEVDQTDRRHSFCQYTLKMSDSEILLVEDATEDERFKDNQLVRNDPNIRFYCGVPLISDDTNLGTLCVIDHVPRKLSDVQKEALIALRDILKETVSL